MKIAILAESAADEKIVRILIDAVLNQPTEGVANPRLSSRGWPSVRDNLSAVVKHLHYRTDADGLVFIVDGNSSPIHVSDDDHRGANKSKCRYCEVSTAVDSIVRTLRHRPDRTTLKIAAAIASPSIEAWLLCGQDPHCTESAWARDLQEGIQSRPRILALKKRLYGTDRPALNRIEERARRAAFDCVGDIAAVEKAFPSGFGALTRELRSWIK